ncbi:MarR family transcriptional regulator [Actinocorallia longicatena]|uniref:MarR family winged helix-turn-helix transcriptional regulator n=1 Tax=Actinocorallia longicatena TaxID=111803 RepID=A0ABP6QFK9_9ACTN
MQAPEDIVEIERALTRVAHLLTRARQHDRTVAAAGVPIDRAALPVLRLLSEAADPMRPSELASRLNVEAPHVTRQIQRLERVGYLTRVPDPIDGRAHRVRVTPAGRDAMDSIRAIGLQWMEEALSDWSASERHQLADLVHRMVDDLADHMELPLKP